MCHWFLTHLARLVPFWVSMKVESASINKSYKGNNSESLMAKGHIMPYQHTLIQPCSFKKDIVCLTKFIMKSFIQPHHSQPNNIYTLVVGGSGGFGTFFFVVLDQ